MSETISQLPLASEANASDLIPATQGSVGAGTGVTRAITVGQIQDTVAADALNTVTTSPQTVASAVTFDGTVSAPTVTSTGDVNVANGSHLWVVPSVVGMSWDGVSAIGFTHPIKASSVNAGESLAIAPASAVINPALYGEVGSLSGTVVGQADLFRFVCSSDTANGTAASNGVIDLVGCYYNVGGSTVNGSRAVIWAQMNVGALTSSSLEMVGISSTIFANAATGGAFFQPLVSSGVLEAGATGAGSLCNEFDYTALAGSTVGVKGGFQVALGTGDAVAGSSDDAGIFFTCANANGISPGMGSAMQLGSSVQGWPLNPTTGSVLTVKVENAYKALGRTVHFIPPSAFAGIDLLNANFSLASGYSFRGPGFSTDGTGQIRTANAILGTTGAGIKLDTPNEIVTGVAVAAGGGGGGSGTNDYYVGDILYDGNGGQYHVTTVSSGAVTGIGLLVGGVAASPPSNPVSTTGGSGINCTLTLTWSVRNRFDANPSGDTVTGKGSAGATTDTTGYLMIPFCAGAPTGVPTNAADGIAIRYDTTNHKLWCFDNGTTTWRGVVLT